MAFRIVLSIYTKPLRRHQRVTFASWMSMVFFDCLRFKNINIVCNLPQDFDAAISDSEARNKFTKQSASLESIENLPKRCGQIILVNKLNGMKCL